MNIREKVLLVGVETHNSKEEYNIEKSLEELENLVISADGEVLGIATQKREYPDKSFFIGSGKLDEINDMVKNMEIDLVVFDDELKGTQVRNIEEVLNVRVIDRTNLILDIFAKRAKTGEGKLQVELAQLNYMLPRLTGMGIKLSRLGAGIGTRGPGEKKLETDKRHIRRRIKFLKVELEKVKKRKGIMSDRRQRNQIPSIALIGYTNSGKSTILNLLCKENVYSDDRLFATLDPTTRKIRLSDSKNAVISDTVGFIRKLPHELVDSFLSTMSEIKTADLLLNIVDASDKNNDEHIKIVYDILDQLQVHDKKMITVYNKIDLLDNIDLEDENNFDINKSYISAKNKTGIESLKNKIISNLF